MTGSTAGASGSTWCGGGGGIGVGVGTGSHGTGCASRNHGSAPTLPVAACARLVASALWTSAPTRSRVSTCSSSGSRHFLAVAEELNFTRAAERLHLAQQGLSASIRRLEDQLGVELFLRDTRRVELTAAGEVLVPGARAVIAAAAAALEQVRLVAQGRTGRLRVGFSTAAGGVAVVRSILRAFAAAAPDVELETVEHDFSDPTAGLADGAVGVAMIFGPLPAPGLASITLLEEGRLIAVRPEHPLAGLERVTGDDLVGLPWLQVPGRVVRGRTSGSRDRLPAPVPAPRSGPRMSGSPRSRPAAGSHSPCPR